MPPKDEPTTPLVGSPPHALAERLGRSLGRQWPFGEALIDPQGIGPDIGENGILAMVRVAQKVNPALIPVATPNELATSTSQIYKRILAEGLIKLAVRISFDELDVDHIRDGLRNAGIRADDCIVIADFAEADLTPAIATGTIVGILDALNEFARWNKIVFQGSNFPARNPAVANGQALVARHEWEAWNAAQRECNVPADQLSFGDYGADSSDINFSAKSNVPPIRHLRYTTPTHTFVARSDQGTEQTAMKKVCTNIINSGHFAGQAFSSADGKIYRIAHGLASAGRASDWRELNTTHHVARVLRDLGALQGIKFRDAAVTKEMQVSLL